MKHQTLFVLPLRHLSRSAKRSLPYSVPGSEVTVRVKEGELIEQDSEMMQYIDVEDMPRPQRRYAKEFEYANRIRVKKIFDINIGGMKIAFSLTALAIFIYFYTMYAMRQETILEEIDAEVAREQGETPEQIERMRQMKQEQEKSVK